MPSSNIPALKLIPTPLQPVGQCEPPNTVSLVADEVEWRRPPAASRSRITASRWRSLSEGTREVNTATPNGCHVVGVALRSMTAHLSMSGRTMRDGLVLPGTLLVLTPGTAARCIFQGPSESLHLHVPNEVIAECAGEMQGSPVLSFETAPRRDAVIERLARVLLAADEVGDPFGGLYINSVGTAMIARLLGWSNGVAASERPRVSELPRWRLKRVVDYIEAHLAEAVSLADVASVAGITRMHFAAQFRAATGLRPHEYLLRRRIERAQEILTKTNASIGEVAGAVGFQTQSHFTSVFKSFVGLPPQAWRLAQRIEVPPSVARRNETYTFDRLAG